MQVEIIGIRQGHLGAIYKLENTPEGTISLGGDGKVILWDKDNFNSGSIIVQTEHACYAMSYNDGYLYLGERDGKVHCISLSHRKFVHTAPLHSKEIFAISVVEDKVIVVSGDGSFSVWSSNLRVLLYHSTISTKSLRNIIYNPYNQCIIISSSDENLYRIDKNSYQVINYFEAHKDSIFALAILPDGSIMSGGKDAQLIQWDAYTYHPMQSIAAHLQTINQISLSPNKNIMATAGRDKCVKLWSVATMQLLKVLDIKYTHAHTHSVNTVLWLDNDHLLSAGDDKRIIEWHIHSQSL